MPIEILFIIFSLVVIAFFIFLLRQMRRLLESGKDEKVFSLLNQNIQNLESRVDSKLTQASNAIMDVQKHLGQMGEIGRSMKEFQDFLRSPKLRGNMGEQVLAEILDQYFPKGSYSLQHKFNDGQIVDAILRTQNGIIPIDAKFPLENFLKFSKAETDEERQSLKREFYKDVRKHISDISRKYILPQEGTVDFAVMYVPSDSLWYEIINSDEDLTSYAFDKKILAVSPNGFFYYMQIILVGIHQNQVQAETRKILRLLHSVRIDYRKLGDTMGVVSTHITNAKGAMDRMQSDYIKVESGISQVNLIEGAGDDTGKNE